MEVVFGGVRAGKTNKSWDIRILNPRNSPSTETTSDKCPLRCPVNKRRCGIVDSLCLVEICKYKVHQE